MDIFRIFPKKEIEDMKKTMKNIIVILLVLLTLFSLAACGSDDSGSKKKNSSDAFVYGDADGDGLLSVLDATRIQRYLAGLEPGISAENMPKAIVSGGSALSVLDATLIRRRLVGLIDQFPCEGGQTEPQTAATDTLVACFSLTGNTKTIAEYAANYLKADLFEITAADPYTEQDVQYGTDCRADREQQDPDARPEIANVVENIGRYKTILLGYPIWHSQAPRIISTFLESYDLSGVTIVPFCTSDASPLGSSAVELYPLSPKAKWMEGIRFEIGTDEQTVQTWIDSLRLGTKTDTASEQLKLTINETPVSVEWENNDAVASLRQAAGNGPITVQMSLNGDFEQVGSLGMDIAQSDSLITAEPGDIILYAGNQICLMFGSNTYDYTRLGKMKDKTVDELRELLAGESVTITISL